MRRIFAFTMALIATGAVALWIAEVGPDGGADRTVAKMAADSNWLGQADRVIAAREYMARRTASGLQAPNRAHGIRTWFDGTGIRVDRREGATGLLSLRLAAVGRGEALAPAGSGSVANVGTRVEIRRSGLVEWYVNDARGLEQGFDVAARLEGEGPLVLELHLDGAKTHSADGMLALETAHGETLHYGKLSVVDAHGIQIASRLDAPKPDVIRIVVDDSRASYPLVIDPILSGQPDGVLGPSQDGGDFGSSVAGAGDVNGDGYDDVIVGTRHFDAGQDDEGAAFIFLGGPGGVANATAAEAATQLESNQPGSYFGYSVAGAGDVNGDGYDDVIVGALHYDDPEAEEGAAFVFHGGPSGVPDGNPSTANAIIESNQVQARLGSSVAGAGDLNGDGYDDVIIGAETYSHGELQEGAAFVFNGGPSGITGRTPADAATILESNWIGASFGSVVAGAGDVNGDGHLDVLVAAPLISSRAGEVYVFHGTATGIPNGNRLTANTRIASTVAGLELGWALDGAGDVNGDGFDDVIIGPGAANEAYIFLGRSTGIPSGPHTSANTVLTGRSAGFSNVAGAGDVNGDGYDDVIIGDQGDAGSGTGRAYVFKGGPAGIASGGPSTAYATLVGTGPVSQFGLHVAGGGDLNGDGKDDVLVTSIRTPFDNIDGFAFVYLTHAACSNGVDDDGDGLIDYPADMGCTSANDTSEKEAFLPCDNGVDDDGDGLVDYPADRGCASTAGIENPACDDGIDNDGDGGIDWDGNGVGLADLQCTQPYRNSELAAARCGIGSELVIVLGALGALARRRGRRR